MKFVKKLLDKVDIILIITFFTLLFKNAFVVGFILDKGHTSLNFIRAMRLIFQYHPYRPFYYLGFILLFLSLAFLFKNRARAWFCIILNLLVSILLAIDVWYLRGFSTLPTLHNLSASKLFSDVFDAFLALIIKKDLLFFIDLPFLILLTIWLKKKRKKLPARPILAGILLATAFSMIFVLAPLANKLTSKVPVYWIFYRFDATSTSYQISPLGYNVYSSILYFKDKKTLKLSKSEKSEIRAWFESKKENLKDNEYKGMFKEKNLIFLQVESLETFVINQKIGGEEITPNLNRLLKNSIYFPKTYEQNGLGNSSDSDHIINTSVYPVQMGSAFLNHPFVTYNSLPKILKKYNYSSVAIHPIAGSFWNWGPAMKSIGFDKCLDEKSYNITEVMGMGLSDGAALPQAVQFIKKEKQPFYAFVVTMSSHTPFDIPEKYKTLKIEPEIANTLMGNYLQLMHYTDEHIGIFIDSLKKEGLLDNTLVAICGDHEGIHKYFPKEVDKIKVKPDWMTNNNRRLPFMLYSPSITGEKRETIGGQIDILPTLCYLLDVEEKDYADTAMGRSLLKTNKSFAVLRNRTVVADQMTEAEKSEALKGLNFADKIIRSNFFKDWKENAK